MSKALAKTLGLEWRPEMDISARPITEHELIHSGANEFDLARSCITSEVIKRRGKTISKVKSGITFGPEYSDIRKKACMGLHTGTTNPMYGKKHTQEALKKTSEQSSNSRWYNNGIIEKFIRGPKPEGFIPGRLIKAFQGKL